MKHGFEDIYWDNAFTIQFVKPFCKKELEM